jgi:hypothetical protein
MKRHLSTARETFRNGTRLGLPRLQDARTGTAGEVVCGQGNFEQLTGSKRRRMRPKDQWADNQRLPGVRRFPKFCFMD